MPLDHFLLSTSLRWSFSRRTSPARVLLPRVSGRAGSHLLDVTCHVRQELNMSADVQPSQRKSKDRITKRATAEGEARYDVRVRLGEGADQDLHECRDAEVWLRQVLATISTVSVTTQSKAG